ncbi:MAG TPA: MFS transporter [Candidatus Acidoferrales bacterium]|nr:MFS transporter [Candidatus Acidoferrales bacterium]
MQLTSRQRRVLVLAGLAVALAGFNGSVLVLTLPAVAAEFSASVRALSNLGSVLALGALGALPLAALADRTGRRRLVALGTAGFSAGSVVSAVAPSVAVLAGARVFSVCFEALVGSVAIALVVEEMPRDRRGLAVSVLTIAGGVGAALVTFSYPAIAPHWRWLYWAGSAGLPAAVYLWRALPEGSTWLAATHVRTGLAVLGERPWQRRILVLAAATVLAAVLLEPAGLFYTLYASRSLHFSPAQISGVTVAAGFLGGGAFYLGGWLSDRVGRRSLGASLQAATAVAASLTFTAGVAGFFVGNVAWSALASAATPVLGAWSAELFPTRARATAEAVGGVAGAVGGVAGLQLVGLLEPGLGLGVGLAVTGLFAFAGAGLLLLLPETRGAPLPE